MQKITYKRKEIIIPLTPFHWGPSSWIGIIFFKIFDFPTLFISSVIVDIEPICVILFNLNYPLHGFFHSFLGGSLLAILTAIIMYFLRNYIKQIMAVFKLKQDSSFLKILWTSLFGVYSHLLLDSFMHSDMKPFYPLQYNSFLNLISVRQLYSFCTWSFLAGIVVYLIRLIVLRMKAKR